MQRAGEDDGRPLSRLELAAKILGVASIEAVASALLARAMLPDGRFEAHEFGRNEHSTASAGALIVGIAGIQQLPDQLLRRPMSCAAALVDAAGNIRGHDDHPNIGSTSWSISQLIFGLLQRYSLVSPHQQAIGRLLDRLIAIQSPGGGWPLRVGEEPGPVFSFYPTLALAKAYSMGVRCDHDMRGAMRLTAHYVADLLASSRLPAELQIMAVHSLECLYAQQRRSVAGCATEVLRDRLLAEVLDDRCNLLLRDRPVVNFQQPMWHSIMWRPLLYLCTRRWASPMSPINALLGGELIRTYEADLSAWSGPEGGISKRTGVSWASALALRAVVALAGDLQSADSSIEEFLARVRTLSKNRFEYDVVISFGGPDRAVAEKMSCRLKKLGLRVFYDRDHQHALLGEDLATYLHATYFTKSRFAIVLLSPAFLASKWAGNWEWRAVLARMQQQRTGYVLPYVVDDVMVPGLSPSIGYARAADFSIDQFCDLVARKVRTQCTDPNTSL